LLWLSDDHRYSLPIAIGSHWGLFVAVGAVAVWGPADHCAGEIKGFLLGNREEPLKGRHGNLLSVRLNAEMKGDYSELGLMPSRHLQQIDLPSSYLIYALWKLSPAEATTFADGASFRIPHPNRTQPSKIEKKLRLLLESWTISYNRSRPKKCRHFRWLGATSKTWRRFISVRRPPVLARI
jgi:hypothetical protein